jgi:Family of unknown function (DUF6152)
MYKLSAALTLAVVLTIPAFAQTPAPANTPSIRIEGAETSGTFGAFEASVLAGLDRQVDAQTNTLATLRAQYNEDFPEVQTAKLNLAILQARRDALARTNADIANMRVAAILDPGLLNRSAVNRAAQPAAHEALFDFSKSQTITGTITILTFVNPYSVVTVDVSGTLTNVFLASANALAAGGWKQGSVKRGDQITITGAPARSGANILQATDASSNGKALFSRPAVELSHEAVIAYEK